MTAAELPQRSTAPVIKRWRVELADKTTRTVEARGFRVEGGALIFVQPVGQQLVTLTDSQSEAFSALLATPNGGLTFINEAFAALPPPPPPIPQQATPLQMRCALRQLGLLDQVNAYVATQTPNMQDSWQYARTIPISNPMVVAVATALNVDLNGLFKLASTFP